MNNLQRPMGIFGSRFSRPTDKEMVKQLKDWCSHIQLAGQIFNIPIEDEAVFQIASQSLFKQKYGIHIYNTDLLKEIMIAGGSEKLKIQFQKEMFGWVVLTRRFFYEPNLYEPNEILREDFYILYVFGINGIPVATVYPSETTPFYVITSSYDPAQDSVSYFPNADDLVVTWHELASIYGISKSQFYLAICMNLLKYNRVVKGSTSKNNTEFELVINAPPSSHLPDRTMQEIRLFAERRNYQMGNSFFVPLASIWSIEAKDKITGEIIPHYIDVPYRRGPNSESQFLFFDRPMVFDDIPKPDLPQDSFHETAIIKLFHQLSEDKANYIGGGKFLLREPNLMSAPPASGTWGSGPQQIVIIGITFAADKVATAGAASAVASAAQAGQSYFSLRDGFDTLDALGDECKKKPTAEECLNCYSGAMESMKDARTAGAAAVGAGVIGVAAAAACLGPLGWIAAGIIIGVAAAGIIVGGSSAVIAHNEIDGMKSDCTKKP